MWMPHIGEPQVAYRETIRKDGVEAEGKFIRQTGGRGQYGHVWLRLFQNEQGKGFEFINRLKVVLSQANTLTPVEKVSKKLWLMELLQDIL